MTAGLGREVADRDRAETQTGASLDGPKPVLCLGEALVDLICERSVWSLREAEMFVPHFGGAVANVALLAARAGAQTALAGGVGDDPWGGWLRDQLREAGVGLDHFRTLSGMATPLALATVDPAGEASYTIYGASIGTVVEGFAGSVDEAVGRAGALFISSNTLVGEQERAVTMAARERALELGLPVIFDPNLRLHRWRTRADAAASANACIHEALLVRCNRKEACLLTGEEDPERAALALRKAGASNVVVTDGARGALLRGKLRQDVVGVPAQVISTIGAGDALMATLIARLQLTGYYEPAIAAALKEGMEAAARACERWGACD